MLDYLYGGAGDDTYVARDFFDQATSGTQLRDEPLGGQRRHGTVRALSSYNLMHIQATREAHGLISLPRRQSTFAATTSPTHLRRMRGNNYLEEALERTNCGA
jgi:hypothetical protein